MLRRRQSDQLQYLLLMVPALIVYTVFHIVPILQTIGLSMTSSLGLASTSEFIGLRNFRRLLFETTPQQETFYRSFKWTAIFWLGNWTLNILLGLGFALMLIENIKLKLFLAGLVMIPEDTLEAAVIAGCSYWQKLIHVVLPQLWPTTISVSILCLTGTWQLFAIPIALSGTSKGAIKALDTVAVVYCRWAFGREGFGMASALMVLIALGLFVGSIGAQRLMKRKTVDY